MLLGEFRREESVAAATIEPGMLLELTSADKVQAHSVSGGTAERAFAVEDALQGKSIEDDYDADDIVSYNLVMPGSVVFAILKKGENVDVGDFLSSDGAGRLIEYTAGSERLAVAIEAKDLSGETAVDTRIPVRVL